jgi:hypothetical protein
VERHGTAVAVTRFDVTYRFIDKHTYTFFRARPY